MTTVLANSRTATAQSVIDGAKQMAQMIGYRRAGDCFRLPLADDEYIAVRFIAPFQYHFMVRNPGYPVWPFEMDYITEAEAVALVEAVS